MSILRTEVVHTSVAAPPHEVISFLSDLHEWKTWAPWIRSVTRSSARDWTLATDAGRMSVHFVEPNSLGVLDHHVTLKSGATVFNSMRVLPNGTGSEVVMVLFQSSDVSDEDFARDVRAVADDLARVKTVAEARTR